MAQTGTPPQIAATATTQAPLPRSRPLLLGVFGRDQHRAALVLKKDGRTEAVGIGDMVDGAQVVAIDQNRIALARRGAAQWITLPN
ncbi:type II secretion system protein N [Salipiger marinus]|uniref:type II secretion system protein N n=1 Tax=Salipiger marinus TaxID=555512 RepID=UPI001E5764F1|nr:type II secretion system protein N [Salipiger manganoxidans]MCD1620045.1 amidophosphoribosyltransferase [Salipiger manganoxidans]MEB3420389.1 type II secretion system protein N [Salipiger manganoxidans]